MAWSGAANLLSAAAQSFGWLLATRHGSGLLHGAYFGLTALFAGVFGGALGTVLQTRLTDVAGEARALAAALDHSAFDTANALGPWLGVLAIAAGWGWTCTGWVAAALALGGLAILGIAAVADRHGHVTAAPCSLPH